MESWSQTPIKDFKVSFFLDTNILCYLVDSTYPNLNKFIRRLYPSLHLNNLTFHRAATS